MFYPYFPGYHFFQHRPTCGWLRTILSKSYSFLCATITTLPHKNEDCNMGKFMVNLWLIYLVGGRPTPLKSDGVNVSWDYEIPNIWKNNKCSKPPTRSSSNMAMTPFSKDIQRSSPLFHPMLPALFQGQNPVLNKACWGVNHEIQSFCYMWLPVTENLFGH